MLVYFASQGILQNIRSLNIVKMKAINKQAPVQCYKSIVINATPIKVWDILTAINQWSDWQIDIRNPRLNGPLKPNSTFNWKTGGANIHSTLHTVTPHQYFGWSGKTPGMLAIHNWTLTEVDGKVEVFVEESMEGLLARLFKKSFNKNLDRDMQHWLTQLKQESEK